MREMAECGEMYRGIAFGGQGLSNPAEMRRAHACGVTIDWAIHAVPDGGRHRGPDGRAFRDRGTTRMRQTLWLDLAL